MSKLSDSSDNVNRCLRAVEEGDQSATTELWEYVYPRLLAYARQKLPSHLRRVLDEEDVALSAFKSFCAGATRGSLGEITGEDELWKLLFCISSRKARSYVREQSRQKRGGGKVSGESVFGDISNRGLEQVPDSRGTLAQFSADCQHLMDSLEDDILQTIALLRIEGYSVDEIATRIEFSRRSVERRLNLIRQIWSAEGADE
ncbi:ECF-type sigma factor [Novipirellula artificiosorum]|uniref:RNA polymerase sigma factor n=1 Tax=Novipirellula artificiosorum TaxID=2528016 RepID=A0A5C6CWZ8_9BACT|nr:ECF-type sigma factor [Novipirellula artificiosorum]TWU28948.1 RNA polymerase sigma factor [Novipirellula artificiosorum]